MRRGYLDEDAALAALADALTAEPCQVTFGDYLTEWIDRRLDLAQLTIREYRKLINAYLIPHLGLVPLNRLTPVMFTCLYRTLSGSGRRTDRKGLSPRKIEYVAAVASSALGDAVAEGLLPVNPITRPLRGYKHRVMPSVVRPGVKI